MDVGRWTLGEGGRGGGASSESQYGRMYFSFKIYSFLPFFLKTRSSMFMFVFKVYIYICVLVLCFRLRVILVRSFVEFGATGLGLGLGLGTRREENVRGK